MSSMKQYYESMSYRELQKIAKGLKVPANLKKNYLVDVITAQKANDERLVKQITDTAYKERLENAGNRRTKKTPVPQKVNLNQSRIAPRDPFLILSDASYNTRQTRSRQKTVQHFRPTVQCTNLSSMQLIEPTSLSASLRYNTIAGKSHFNNQNTSSIHTRRNSIGRNQKDTVLETLLTAPTSANLQTIAADCSRDGMDVDKDPCFSTAGGNWKNQWIAGTSSDNNTYMGEQQYFNQPSGSKEGVPSTFSEQAMKFKISNFKIPRLDKSNKRTSRIHQNEEAETPSDVAKKIKLHDHNIQTMLKNNHIARDLGMQLNNSYSEDFPPDLHQISDNSNNYMQGVGIGEMNDSVTPCYPPNYIPSSNIENYHNFQDDDAFFSHNLERDIDQMNPPLSNMTEHSNENNQNNYSLFNYGNLNESEELFDMFENESQNDSYGNICNQDSDNNNDPMVNMHYNQTTFFPTSGCSIDISQHSIQQPKEELLSQRSNAIDNEERNIPCSANSLKPVIDDLPGPQSSQKKIFEYNKYILNSADTESQNGNINFASDLPVIESYSTLQTVENNNMNLVTIPAPSNSLGMMDDDIPIADDRETSQPSTAAGDLMRFYRIYGRWEEPYRPMRGTATAMLCFLCNWFGMVAKFDEHLRKKHLEEICTTFHGMVTADVNLGALAAGNMLDRQQIIIEHGNHLFVLRFKFKPPDTVCAIMLMVPPKGLVTMVNPFPAIVHIQAVNQDTQVEVLWSGPIDCLNEPNRPTDVDVFANRCNGRFEVMMREISIVPDNLPENEINLQGLSLAVNIYIQTLEDIQKAEKEKELADAAKIVEIT